ncbi:hypothetical protein ACQP1V_20990 [Microtetraspora malaysiensis]
MIAIASDFIALRPETAGAESTVRGLLTLPGGKRMASRGLA